MTPEQSKQYGKGCEPHVKVEWLSHFAQLCRESKERYEGSYLIPFCEEWFSLPTNDYNPGLAYAGMGICLSGYKNLPSNEYKYIRGSLNACGFEDIDISSFYHLNDENHIASSDNVNIVSYALGHKTIKTPEGNDAPLVVVEIRGTSVSVEWDSNADVADSVTDGDYDIAYHEGFQLSSENTFKGVMKYIRKHGLATPDSRLWIIAHSRGATMANIVAAMFDEDETTGFTKDRIYAYTYSSSTTTNREDATGPKFDNIFNLLNPEDYIPRIPPYTWAFNRYGRDVYFPSICTNYADYRKWRPEFLKRFKEWTRVDFPAFHGFEYTNGFEHSIANVSPDCADMYQHKRLSHSGTLTFAQYFRIFCDTAAWRGKELLEDAGDLAKYGDATFSRFLKYFLNNEILGHKAPGAHQEEGYLIKLMLCYEMDIDLMSLAGGSSPDYNPDNYVCDTERLTVYGPVRLMVKDAEGRIVADIDKGRIDKNLYNNEDFISMFYDKLNDSASVWVPGGIKGGKLGNKLGYTIEITPAKSGEVDFTVSAQKALGPTSWLNLYADVPLEKGKTVTWDEICPEAPTNAATDAQTFNVNTDVAALTPDGPMFGNTARQQCIDSHGNGGYGTFDVIPPGTKDGFALASYYPQGAHLMPIPGPAIVADSQGYQEALYGQHVCAEAYHTKHARFVGWYDKGADLKNDKPLCKELKYSFRVEGDRELIALFEMR